MASNEEIAILDRPIEKVDDKPEEKKIVTPPLEPDDEEEIEEPEEELEEEEAPKESLAPHERPTVAQITKEFPEVFKKFPFLRDIYFREQKYTELFPTLAEASEAIENNEAFSSIREDVFNGDSVKFLEALKESDGLERFSRNILNSLYKVSPEIQWNTIAPVLQNAVRAFYNNSDDENDRNAALRISKFLFNDSSVAEGKKSVVKEVKEEPKEDKEKENWKNERYNTFNVDTLSGISDGLTAQIMDKIDPDGVLSEFMKNAIVNETITEIRKQLQADSSHMSYMRNLWSKAEKNGYTNADKSSISTAFLARAKVLVPSIRRKLLAEALGTSAKINSKKVDIIDKGQNRREPGNSGRVSNNGTKAYDPKQIDFRKTSEMDIINGTATLKK